ncbi:hypothetical protein [Tuwongella immobilis]|uniref:Uncharacterized protein n=1 Tax=Tuwongella immobilis TaxID=692036 RepID=A0A6C2YRW1_9BACT|nr:hypothetical protein [Tuwongella immobilis]VIP03863.1 unnamed protein product [Tuwongella immobilis]VTS05093.1 unnamed protein product [Tuwongella immobilis]
MGNPAGEKRKKKEKRRAKLEQRLSIGAFAEKTPRVRNRKPKTTESAS